ncbi:hypothetical protein CCP3SC1_240031 [Gammaproteobacteria bacterium]
MRAPVQYEPRVKAAVVHQSQHHMLPAQRSANVLGDLCDLPLSDATVLAAVSKASKRLEPTVAVIAQAVVASPIAHAGGRQTPLAACACHWPADLGGHSPESGKTDPRRLWPAGRFCRHACP